MAAIQPISGISLPQVNAHSVRYATVPGYPAYAVGDDGSVWSLWRMAGRGKKWRITESVWKKLKPHSDCYGRKTVFLSDGHKPRQHKIHRLVLLAFIGECPPGMEACHNNGINSDNRLVNLRWDTKVSNAADKLLHGTHTRGERSGTSKLTKQQVVEITSRYRDGESSRSLSIEFGISANHVTRLYNKGCWPEVFEHDTPHVDRRSRRK